MADAKKERIEGKAALKVLTGMDRLIVAKGQKKVEVDLKKDKLSDKEKLALLLGPSGNLRAPTIVKGKTVIVGFHSDTYQDEF